MNGDIAKSTNGGINWQVQNSGTPDRLFSIFFISPDTGWVTGDWGTVLYTSNGGGNWVPQNSYAIGYLLSVFFINPFTGWISGSGGKIIFTTNSGNNWFTQVSNTNENLNAIYFSSSQNGCALGNNGTFLRTTNSGQTWNPQNTGIGASIFQASFPNSSDYFAVGDSGIVIKSSNAGNNWNVMYRQYPFLDNFHSIYFINNSTGWCVSDSGLVIKSTNSGYNWTLQYTPTKMNLFSVYFPSQNTGWIAGGGLSYINNNIVDSNVILYTTNGGSNWVKQFADTNRILNSLFFINQMTGWAVGAMGITVKTTNGGLNWIKYNGFNAYDLTCVFFTTPDTGWAGGGSWLFITSNGGINWVPRGSFLYPTSIDFINSSTGWVVTEYGKIGKTTNSGQNWSVQNLTPYGFSSICFTSAETGWITGGPLLKTTNAGTNWVEQTTPHASLGNNFIFFSAPDIGWAVGGNGTIIHTSPLIGIKTIHNEIPNSFILYQNYPNPFNPITKIHFSIPLNKGELRGLSVRLSIYDILGREVAPLINQQLKPGSYEVDWDGTNYASGIYFYRLEAGDFVATNKMVLLK